MLASTSGAALAFLAASSSLVQQAQALSLKVHKHHRPLSTRSTGTGRRHLETRADPAPLDLDNLYDLYYSTDLTIGGQGA